MDYLEESLEKLHEENEQEKQEINMLLDQLLQSGSATNQTLGTSPSKYIHTSELCIYEQKLHHKFTEVKFELQKFIALNKPPKCKIKVEKAKTEMTPVDIETLKANSMMLIHKMDDYGAKNEKSNSGWSLDTTASSSSDSTSSDVTTDYPYVPQSILAKLSNHTKEILNNIKANTMGKFHNTTPCGHHPEIKQKFPNISKPCSGDFNVISTVSCMHDNDSICGHFPSLEQYWPEIIEICPKRTNLKFESRNSIKSSYSDLSKPKGEHNFLGDSFLDLHRSEEVSKPNIDLSIINRNMEIVDELHDNSKMSGKKNISNLEMRTAEIEENDLNLNSIVESNSKNEVIQPEAIIQESLGFGMKQNGGQINDSCIEEKYLEAKIEDLTLFSINDQINFDVQQKIQNETSLEINNEILKSNENDSNVKIEEINQNSNDFVEEQIIKGNAEKNQGTDTNQTTFEEIGAKTEKMNDRIEIVQGTNETSNATAQAKNRTESSSSSNYKLNNEVDRDNSAISESDCEKSSEDDKVHTVGYDADKEHLPEKKKKSKCFKEMLSKSTDSRALKDLKSISKIQNNLVADSDDTSTYEDCLSDSGLTEDSASNKDVKDCNLNANMSRVCTLEDKLRKLGLEDSRTRFEKTRKEATLPDVRLQPSVSDNEKMKQMQNQINKYEICDRAVPAVNERCVFSHVQSPSEFYVHLDNEESKLIDRLNEIITKFFTRSKTLYKSKYETCKAIGKFCCAYIKGEKMYYRAEVVDWDFEHSTKLVKIQLVDYGNYKIVHYKHLRELTQDFVLIPKIAVKCYLPLLYPPQSTKYNVIEDWPLSSVQAFIDLSGLHHIGPKKFFSIVFVEKDEDFCSVDLRDLGDPLMRTVGELLIRLGHAVEIVFPEDDPMGVLNDDEELQRLEECNNVNEVILGYDPRDEARICRFTRKDGTCFKGRNCKLEHIPFNQGGYTTDFLLTYTHALNDMRLPRSGDCVEIRFTTFLGATHYYVNILAFAQSLVHLEDIINAPKICSELKPYKIMPAYGEIVLVKHWNARWLRAKVRHHSNDDEGNCIGVQVFMVDYGDVIDVSLKDVRHIKEEFLELPFQAVECILHNYKAKNNVDLKEMDQFFYDNIAFRTFLAQIMAVSDMLLCVTVYLKEENLGDILVQQGFLSKVNKRVWFPSDKSLVCPA